ncbi:MAG: conjugal transfer protein TraF [Vicinamibacterales bacterium]
MRIIAVLALLLSLTIPVSTNAQSFGGVGTRAEGMGGAFVAVADDASAVYWNPAGIATGATFDLQVSKGGDSSLFVGAALPVLGASYYRTRAVAGLSTVSGSADRQTGGSGEVQVGTLTTTNFGVTVVQTVAPGLVIGTTARVVRGGVGGAETRTTVDFDAGAMVSAWDMRFGLAARNLREPEFQLESGVMRLHRQLRVGAALVPRALPTGAHGPFSLAIDADLTTTPGIGGDRRSAAAGGEYWLAKGLIGVRAGVRWSTLGDSTKAVSGGLTVRLPRSVHVEGQMTKEDETGEHEWNIGARVTF